MLFAWYMALLCIADIIHIAVNRLVLSPIATLSARYLKNQTKKWFTIHQYAQIAAILLTAASAVVVLSIGTGNAGYHGVIGFVILGAAAFQTLLGFLRNIVSGYTREYASYQSLNAATSDKGPRRWLFNLLHRSVGRLLFVLAYINVFFGLRQLHADNTVMYLFYAAAALTSVIVLINEVYLRRSPSGPNQLYIAVFATITLASLAAAIVGLLARAVTSQGQSS